MTYPVNQQDVQSESGEDSSDGGDDDDDDDDDSADEKVVPQGSTPLIILTLAGFGDPRHRRPARIGVHFLRFPFPATRLLKALVFT